MTRIERPEKLERPEAVGGRRRALRPYPYLTISVQDRENPHLTREMVKCGKPACRAGLETAARPICVLEVRGRRSAHWADSLPAGVRSHKRAGSSARMGETLQD